MRIVTLNFDGIRSAAKKGFFDWTRRQDADVVCVQEIRAQEDHCSRQMLGPKGYFACFHCAEKKGYAGHRRQSRRRVDLQAPALLRPRPAHHRLRLRTLNQAGHPAGRRSR